MSNNTQQAIYIGGSDAATIMGANKYQSPLELWQIKTGRRPRPDLTDKSSVQWGIRLERPILQHLMNELSIPINDDNCQVRLEQGFRVGVLDYQIDDENFIEIKTTGYFAGKDWENGVPEYYLWQVYHYFGLMPAAKKAVVACLIGGQDFVTHEIYRTKDVDDYINVLWQQEQEFYLNCINDEAPVRMVATETMNIDMEPDVEVKVEEYFRVNEQKKALEKQLEELRIGVAALIGQNRAAIGTRYKASYKYIATSTVDWKAIVRDYRIPVDNYSKESGYFKLDIRRQKNG